MGNSNRKNIIERKQRNIKVHYNNVDVERVNDLITRIIKDSMNGVHPLVKVHVTLEYAIQQIPK